MVFAQKEKVKIEEEALRAVQKADAICFSSAITNEEASALQKIKEKFGVKLYSEDARLYGEFMQAYASISGSLHATATLLDLDKADGIVVIGTRVFEDRLEVYDALKSASCAGAKIVYAHPIESVAMQNISEQFIKYEVGTEEGVMALLANELLKDASCDATIRAFFDDLDLGYLEAESNVGDDELLSMRHCFASSRRKVLVVGPDMFAHKRAKNIAKLAAVIEKYTDFSLFVMPAEKNSAGVSLICSLDPFTEENLHNTIDYHRDSSLVAFCQSRKTVVDLNSCSVPTKRAFALDGELEEIDDLPEYNGTVVYLLRCNKESVILRGSMQFAIAAKIDDGDEVEITLGKRVERRVFKLEKELKGTIALNPMSESGCNYSGYRFLKSKIVRVI